MIALSKLSETATKITLGWTPVPGVIGYRFQSAATAPKWSHTFDASRAQVTFSKAAWYKVEALGVEAAGEYPSAVPPPPPPSGWPASYFTGPAGQANILPPKPGVLVGAAGTGGDPSADPQLVALEGLSGRKLDIEHRFINGCTVNYNTGDGDGLPATVSRGHIPMISIGPSVNNGGAIIAGEADACLTQLGNAIAAQPHKFFLRMFWEFDGTWYPWSKNKDGSLLNSAQFKTLWQRTVDVMKPTGCFAKTSLVWCPHGDYWLQPQHIDARAAYPGDTYVDWVATDNYDHGNPRRSAQFMFANQAAYFKGRKPFMIGETSAVDGSGGVKGTYWTQARDWLKTDPGVQAFVAFDVNYSDADWRIRTSQASIDGWKALVSDPYLNP